MLSFFVNEMGIVCEDGPFATRKSCVVNSRY